jgi:hypothetical protein
MGNYIFGASVQLDVEVCMDPGHGKNVVVDQRSGTRFENKAVPQRGCFFKMDFYQDINTGNILAMLDALETFLWECPQPYMVEKEEIFLYVIHGNNKGANPPRRIDSMLSESLHEGDTILCQEFAHASDRLGTSTMRKLCPHMVSDKAPLVGQPSTSLVNPVKTSHEKYDVFEGV